MRSVCILAALVVAFFPGAAAHSQDDGEILGRLLREADRQIGQTKPRKQRRTLEKQLRRLTRACEDEDIGACQRLLSKFTLSPRARSAIKSKVDRQSRAKKAFNKDYQACVTRSDIVACRRALTYAAISADKRSAITQTLEQHEQRQAEIRRRAELARSRKAQQRAAHAHRTRYAALVKACEAGSVASCDQALKLTKDRAEYDRLQGIRIAILNEGRPKSKHPPATQQPPPAKTAEQAPPSKRTASLTSSFSDNLTFGFMAGGLVLVLTFALGKLLLRRRLSISASPRGAEVSEITSPMRRSTMSADVTWHPTSQDDQQSR